jgi:hypothetical protein
LQGKPQALIDEVSLHDEIQLFCKWISPTRVCNKTRHTVGML